MNAIAPRYALRIKGEWIFQALIVVIIGMGMILRASKYAHGWSMRGDELSVTYNLIHRSLFELISRPLDFEQVAPVGFLFIVKILVLLFGQSEYVLRFPALLAGCISILLMQNLLNKINGKYGKIFALSTFAFGNYLIYYSSELKQYSTDVLISITLLLIFHQHIFKKTTAKDFLTLAGIGILAMCFSHSAVFILAGIGLSLLINYPKDKQRLIWILLTGALWAGTFLALYMLLLSHQIKDQYLITFWNNLESFMPMPPWRNLFWFPQAAGGLFGIVAGLSSSLIVIIPIYLLGCWGFFIEKKWQWVLALNLPIALNVIASGFQKYPFHGRVILYLVPLILVVLGKGIDMLITLFHNRAIANIVFAALIVLLLNSAIPTTTSFLFTHNYLKDDLKSVLSYMEKYKQKGDLIYVYYNAAGPYRYYAPLYNLGDSTVIQGTNNSQKAKRYDDELNSLPRGKRIWFVFSFVYKTKVGKDVKQNEREYILNYLEQNGEMIDEFYSTNDASSAHLFILK